MIDLIIFASVICLGYASYRVWFHPEEFRRMLQELYSKSSYTPRAFAGSKFTLWGFRLITTALFLVMLAIFLGSVFFWILDKLR